MDCQHKDIDHQMRNIECIFCGASILDAVMDIEIERSFYIGMLLYHQYNITSDIICPGCNKPILKLLVTCNPEYVYRNIIYSTVNYN